MRDRIQTRRFRKNSNASTTALMNDSKKKNCIYNCTYERLEEQKKADTNAYRTAALSNSKKKKIGQNRMYLYQGSGVKLISVPSRLSK